MQQVVSKEVISVKKIFVSFLIIFIMIIAVSCKKNYRVFQVTIDSVKLENGYTGKSVLLHKGDEVLLIPSKPSQREAMENIFGRKVHLVEYQGIRGYIYEEYVTSTFKQEKKKENIEWDIIGIFILIGIVGIIFGGGGKVIVAIFFK
jgi:hypothetical protein